MTTHSNQITFFYQNGEPIINKDIFTIVNINGTSNGKEYKIISQNKNAKTIRYSNLGHENVNIQNKNLKRINNTGANIFNNHLTGWLLKTRNLSNIIKSTSILKILSDINQFLDLRKNLNSDSIRSLNYAITGSCAILIILFDVIKKHGAIIEKTDLDLIIQYFTNLKPNDLDILIFIPARGPTNLIMVLYHILPNIIINNQITGGPEVITKKFLGFPKIDLKYEVGNFEKCTINIEGLNILALDKLLAKYSYWKRDRNILKKEIFENLIVILGKYNLLEYYSKPSNNANNFNY